MHIAYPNGPRLRRSLLAGCDYVEAQRRELNRINVFPGPVHLGPGAWGLAIMSDEGGEP